MNIHDGHRRRVKERFRQHGMDIMEDHEVLDCLLYTSPAHPGLIYGRLGQTGYDHYVVPGGYLRHHSPVQGVHIRLGQHLVGQHLPAILSHRRGGLVAGGLYRQYLHSVTSHSVPGERM